MAPNVLNLADLVRRAAADRGDHVALVEDRAGRRALTWREVDEAATALARGLSGLGLRAGHRVALVMANRIDLPIAYVAALRGGMIAVPMNPRSTPAELARMLADCSASVVLCDETSVAAVREAAEDLDVHVVVDGPRARRGETAFDQVLSGAPAPEPAAPRDPEAPAVILYTSGTSGRPRGAVLSHRALLANIEQTAAVEPSIVEPDDVLLGLLPLFHVYGLNAVLGQAMRQQATVVLVDGFDPGGLLRTIAAEGVTNVALAPPVVAAWAGRDDLREHLAGVKHVLSGASVLDPELAAHFAASAGLHVEQGYGLTEAAPVITTTLASPRPPDQPPGPHSVGRALPGIELRFVDATGREADAADPAEIWIRGDNLFSGYWPDGADGPRPDGWYPTGDIGYRDAAGDVVLVDRLRELVIVSGFNVYPAEVEAVATDVEGVQEVAVVGRADPATGEAVVAFVVPEDDQDDPAALEERVREACRQRLARFKQPADVVVVEGLPHSATGKVAKGRLRAMVRSADLGLR